MMLNALKDFDKAKLRSTETTVKTVDGRVLSEKKDEHGRRVVKEVTSGELGYVGDVKQDLQVGEVLPGLIIGSQDVAHDWSILSSYPVTHILNAASLVENIFQGKITYKDIKIFDIPEERIIDKFPEAHEFIDQGRQVGCILVHCNAGVSRAATLVISYLMKHKQMSFSEAHEYLKQKRPAIRPNDGFKQQLQEYAEHLKMEQAQS